MILVEWEVKEELADGFVDIDIRNITVINEFEFSNIIESLNEDPDVISIKYYHCTPVDNPRSYLK